MAQPAVAEREATPATIDVSGEGADAPAWLEGPTVTILAPSDEPSTATWRLTWPAAELRRWGYPVQLRVIDMDEVAALLRETWAGIDRPDLYLLHRNFLTSWNRIEPAWIARLQSLGSRVIVDGDDNLYTPGAAPRALAMLEGILREAGYMDPHSAKGQGMLHHLQERASLQEYEAARRARLVERPDERRDRAQRLARWVQEERSVEANLWRWPAAWRAIMDATGRRRSGAPSGQAAADRARQKAKQKAKRRR